MQVQELGGQDPSGLPMPLSYPLFPVAKGMLDTVPPVNVKVLVYRKMLSLHDSSQIE